MLLWIDTKIWAPKFILYTIFLCVIDLFLPEFNGQRIFDCKLPFFPNYFDQIQKNAQFFGHKIFLAKVYQNIF